MAEIPSSQAVLLLRGPKQAYQLEPDYLVPDIGKDHEVLVRSEVFGLNPIDWKAPDFNFGIPVLPYIAGRELVGQVVRKGKAVSRLSEGDRVLVISTDYRDLRKAAFQQYVVSSDFNAVRIPPNVPKRASATIGVAFVAAALSLGVCMGVDFSGVHGGPNLLNLVRSIDPELLPEDIRAECRHGIRDQDRARSGDWLAIWGGSSTSANLAVQLARLAGMKVLTVVDSLRHGLRLANHDTIRPDLLVDSHDHQRAVEIIRANIGDKLRFALDTTGRETSKALLRALSQPEESSHPLTTDETPPATPPDTTRTSTAPLSKHLIGLTGLPKERPPVEVSYHTVPIKLFHEVPAVGEALALWLETLLENGIVTPPEVLHVEAGFDGVNRGLDRMRQGEVRGGRIVVEIN